METAVVGGRTKEATGATGAVGAGKAKGSVGVEEGAGADDGGKAIVSGLAGAGDAASGPVRAFLRLEGEG